MTDRRREAAARVARSAMFVAVIVVCAGLFSCTSARKGATDVDALGVTLQAMTPEEQLDYLRGVESKGRADASLYFHIGNAFYSLEQLDSAVVYYGRSVKADSTYTKSWVNMGLAYDGQGQVQASRRAFEEALSVDPNDVLALCHLGFSYFTRGQADLAMDYYQRALTIDPNSAQAHYNLGLAFADAKIFGEALLEWQKVVALDPDGELGKTAAENVELIHTYLQLEE